MQLKVISAFIALCAVHKVAAILPCVECTSNCGRQTTRLTRGDDGRTWTDGTLHQVIFTAVPSKINLPSNFQLTITRPGKTEVFAIQFQNSGLKRYYLNGGATCSSKWDPNDKPMQIFVGPAP